jgi:ribose/xylose/arabinose/galactoside ABC-type transport system permease subunit
MAPRLEVEGVGQVALPLQPVQGERLIAVASRAPYGRGADTVLDESVRRTWQIGPEQVRLGGKHRQTTLDRIVASVRGCGGGSVAAEPEGRPRVWLGGLCFGMALATKYTFAFALAGFVPLVLLARERPFAGRLRMLFALGLGVVLLGLPPIVITLATNGILQGFALVYSNGTPDGFSSPTLRWFMTGSIHGVTPVVLLVVLFVVAALVLLGRTAFGRRVYAVGNSAKVATLSGVGVGATLIGVYALSGFCAALVGILLTGFSGQASLGMGDEYLLPSIAVVVVGGTLITGGRGHYVGMLGGVLLLTALLTLLAGTTLPHAVRDIIFGLVVLGAVLALRERSS